MRSRRFRSAFAATAAVAVVAAAPAEAKVRQMVVFRSGRAVTKNVPTRGLKVKVGHKRCAVASRTPLAELFRGHPGPIGLRGLGSSPPGSPDATPLLVPCVRRD